MRFRDARRLFIFWKTWPPEHELIAMFAKIYTTWTPEGAAPKSEEEAQAAHRKSLEQRWRAGAMNVKDLFESTGGSLTMNQSHQ